VSIGTKKYGDESINKIKLTAALLTGKFAYYAGNSQPSLSAPNGYGDPTGVTGDVNRALFGGLTTLTAQYHVKGTQTLLGPLLDTTGKGLEVSQDQTNNDGIEYVFGALNTLGRHTFVVGTDNAYIEIKFEIEDVSGSDQILVGFRKNEAFQADWNDYDELAAIDMVSGDIKTSTILNNAATTNTDSGENWADGETHTLRVELKGRSVAFFLDGSPLAGVPAYRFDNAEVVLPFFLLLQDVDITKCWWKHVEVGPLSEDNSNGTA
jgi:hypothetical protein